jgi:hypothetical protein
MGEISKLKRRTGPGTAISNRNWLGSLRRRSLAYALAGGLALFGGEVAREQIPFWVGAKKEYSMELVFLLHNSGEGADQVMNEVDLSAGRGRPIRLLFLEEATSKESDYEKAVKEVNGLIEEYRDRYDMFVENGLKPKDAKKRIEQELDVKTSHRTEAFVKGIIVGAAVRGLIVLPIEAYSDADSERMKDFGNYLGSMQKKWEELCNRDAPLGELAAFKMKEQEGTVGYMKIRNENVAKNIRRRFEVALKLFPSLRMERLEGSELCGIGCMGLGHRTLFYEFGNLGSEDLEVSMKEFCDPKELSLRVDTALYTTRPFTKREGYLSAAGYRYHSLIKSLAQASPAEAERGVAHAFTLSEAELDRISAESAKMADGNKRAAFILNGLMGAPYFN